jgi:hypothetical protein
MSPSNFARHPERTGHQEKTVQSTPSALLFVWSKLNWLQSCQQESKVTLVWRVVAVVVEMSLYHYPVVPTPSG